MVTLTTPLFYFRDNPVYGHHLPVPPEALNDLADLKDNRVLCTINGKETLHAALIPDGKGAFYILINKDVRNKLGLSQGQEVSISLRTDDSRYGMDMPEELGVLLDQEQTGSELFHKLTPGKQRSLIHWVGTVKHPDKRLKRANVMIRHLISLQGNIDYKQLNADMKVANQLK
ncbi:MAG: YdeI/OmpD-associated family protein [Cyclobacteriaceae bacterium]